MNTKICCGATLAYLFMVAVIDVSITIYLLNQVPSNSMNHGLISELTLWFFTVPAFFLGFILFRILDWGLRHIWYERSSFGLLPIAFALAIPFIWEYLILSGEHNILFPIAISVTMLLWSVFVVGLQSWFE